MTFIQTSFAALVGVALLSNSTTAVSQVGDESGDNSIQETLVVANRIEQDHRWTAAAIEQFDREDLQRSLAADLNEALQSATGFHVTRNGGAGQNGSLFLRGTDSDHTLIIIDGQPVNSLSDGRARLEFLPLANIEQVEIVRGARSSLYGSEAIGGVVSITTRKPADDFEGNLSAIGGSNSLAGTSLSLGGALANIQLNGGMQHQSSEGTDARVGANPDRDGFEKRDVWLGLSGDLGTATGVRLNLSDNRSESDFDDSFWAPGGQDGWDQFDRQQVSIGMDHRLGNELTARINLTRSSEHYLSEGVFGPFQSDSDRRMASAKLDWKLTDGRAVAFIAEYQQDRYQSNYLAGGLDRDNFSIAAVGEMGEPQTPLTISLRQDNNEQYGSHLTGQLSLGRNSELGFFWASYGTAFKAPNFFDLYGFGGDPNLEPEESDTSELGWRQQFEHWQPSASLYRIKTSNLIEYDNNAMQIFNTGDARIEGFELAIDGQLAGLDLGLRLDLMQHQNRDTGEPLIRRPEETVGVTIGRNLNHWGWQIDATHSGNSIDFGGQPLSAWTRIDGSLRWQFSTRFDMQFKLLNLTDERYETVANYRQPGREFRLSMDYRF